MKKYLLTLVGLALATPVLAQGNSAIGQYEQESFMGPDNLKGSETDVTLSKDPRLRNVVWIANLLPGGRVKALVFTSNDEGATYSIPAQKVGNFQVQLGCATYSQEGGELTVSLNNKSNCFGMKQSDYNGGVSVTRSGGVQAGNTSVNGRGIHAPGVSVSNGGVRVDTRAVMAGVQYVGHKQGVAKATDDD